MPVFTDVTCLREGAIDGTADAVLQLVGKGGSPFDGLLAASDDTHARDLVGNLISRLISD